MGRDATRLGSSQVFFRNGWTEHNPRYTVSGRADDVAISYAAGNRQILKDSIADLRVSLANNVTERVVERLLTPRYSNHRKLIRVAGWIERCTMASYWSYRLSASHFRQWQRNKQRARQIAHE